MLFAAAEGRFAWRGGSNGYVIAATRSIKADEYPVRRPMLMNNFYWICLSLLAALGGRHY
jgi:hypothetical protein